MERAADPKGGQTANRTRQTANRTRQTAQGMAEETVGFSSAPVHPSLGESLQLQRATDILRLQGSIGNQAVTNLIQSGPMAPVQRAINVDAVTASKESLGIAGEVKVVEAPRRAKATALISSYPDTSKLNLPGSITAESMASLNFPDQTPQELQESWSDATAYEIVDGLLGGGAYNHGEDLVVLAEGYSEAALRHEMGHKKQNEGGFNAGTVSVVILEYHNFLANENKPWLDKGTGKPRLAYDAGAAKKKPNKTWAELREHAKGTLHHEQPQAVAMLDAIEVLLTNEKYAPMAKQIQDNLISEYFQKNG